MTGLSLTRLSFFSALVATLAGCSNETEPTQGSTSSTEPTQSNTNTVDQNPEVDKDPTPQDDDGRRSTRNAAGAMMDRSADRILPDALRATRAKDLSPTGSARPDDSYTGLE